VTEAKVVLFDLDGTLLRTGGAGRRAMDQALREVGLADGLGTMRLDGMTDRAIVREAAVAHQLGCDVTVIDAVLARYLVLLEGNIAACAEAEYVVLPGVADAVRALRERGLAVGLGTGNVEPGARIKLARSGLNAHLPFGGFGSDAEDRAELLAAGVRRAEELLGLSLDPESVWIVGDTPKDVTAGKRIGAKVLAVATGHYSVDALVGTGADIVVPDLAHPDAWRDLGL